MSAAAGRKSSRLRLVASLGVAGGAGALVAWLPRHSGSSWSDVGRVVADVPLPILVALGGLWMAGLVASSVALAACLPGLPVRRALTLSLTGSAVANVLPLGGAAGVGTNFAMARSWGYRSGAFATFTVVTNLVDVATKVVVVGVAGGLVLITGRDALPSALAAVALAVAAVILLGAALLLRTSVATSVGRRVDAATALVGRLLRRPLQPQLETRLPRLAGSSVLLLRGAWVRIVAGSSTYAVLQAVLLAACLHVCGLRAGVAMVAAAYAMDRLLTLLPLTPGGVGLVETALCATVLAWGAPAGPVVAGVLLYRALTYAAEVPVGGALLLTWLLGQPGRAQLRAVRQQAAPDPVA